MEEKKTKRVDPRISKLMAENRTLWDAIRPMLPVARAYISIHDARRTPPERAVDIGLPLRVIRGIAELEEPKSAELGSEAGEV